MDKNYTLNYKYKDWITILDLNRKMILKYNFLNNIIDLISRKLLRKFNIYYLWWPKSISMKTQKLKGQTDNCSGDLWFLRTIYQIQMQQTWIHLQFLIFTSSVFLCARFDSRNSSCYLYRDLTYLPSLTICFKFR